MLKKSLIGSIVLLFAMLFVLTGCEGPTGPTGLTGKDSTVPGKDGNTGKDSTVPGLTGGIVLDSVTVDAEFLKAAFETTQTTVILGPSVTEVEGEVPDGKILRVVGSTVKVPATKTLALVGTGSLVLYFTNTEFQADGNGAGYLTLTGTGTISGAGALLLAVNTDDSPLPDGAVTYTSDAVANFDNKEVSSVIASGSGGALTAVNIPDVFDFLDEITVSDITGIVSDTIPANKTLILNGDDNTIDVSGGAFTPASGAALVNNGIIKVTTTDAANLTSVITNVSGHIVANGDITTLAEAFTVPSGVTLDLAGASTFASGDFPVTVEGTLSLGSSVTGFAPYKEEITVTGTLKLAGSSAVTAAVAVNGTGSLILAENSKIKGDVTVDSTASLALDGEIEGNVEAAGDLTVGETGTITGKVEVTGHLALESDATIATGPVTAATLESAGDITGDVTVTGNITLTGAGTITGAVESDSLTLNDTSKITGDVTSGSLTLNDTSEIEGSVTVDGALAVGTGASTITGDVSAGTIALTGDLTIGTAGDLAITDPATVSGTGNIIAEVGTITIDSDEYTTTEDGVVGSDLTATTVAAVAITAEAGLIDDSGKIGTVTAAQGVATPITKSGGDVTVTSGITLTGTLTGTGISGDSGPAANQFTVSLTDSSKVSVADSAWTGETGKTVTVGFNAVQLQYKNLIGPVLTEFHIAVTTNRN
jgi:cytoskeletal protein CcmA (bactofilin family)